MEQEIIYTIAGDIVAWSTTLFLPQNTLFLQKTTIYSGRKNKQTTAITKKKSITTNKLTKNKQNKNKK